MTQKTHTRCIERKNRNINEKRHEIKSLIKTSIIWSTYRMYTSGVATYRLKEITFGTEVTKGNPINDFLSARWAVANT